MQVLAWRDWGKLQKENSEQNEDSWSLGRDLNTWPTEYDAGVPTTQSGCLVYKDD